MIDKNNMLQNAEKFVYDKLHTDTSGHDWWHVVRVRNTARELAEKEGADQFICELAALLHDMADDKLNANPEQALTELKVWLMQQELSEEAIDHIIQIITTMSFKGSGQSVPQLWKVDCARCRPFRCHWCNWNSAVYGLFGKQGTSDS